MVGRGRGGGGVGGIEFGVVWGGREDVGIGQMGGGDRDLQSDSFHGARPPWEGGLEEGLCSNTDFVRAVAVRTKS